MTDGNPDPGCPPPLGPLVSVLLPVRDGGPHLEAALDSILGQTLEDLEVVAVDDGSTDGTPGVLERAARRDGRVRVLRQGPRGIVPALELARSRMGGTYLARMDADDLAEPDRLRSQVDLLRAHPQVALCGTGVRYFPDPAVREGARRYQAWLNAGDGSHRQLLRELFVECPLAHPTFMARADAVEAVGGYRDRGWAEDYDLLLRLVRAGGRLARVPRVLHRWRESPDRLSRKHPRYSRAAFRRCKAHHLLRGPLEGGARPALMIGAGPVSKALARELRAAGGRVLAFLDLDPRRIGQEIHGLPVRAADPPPRPGELPPGTVALGAVGQPGAREEIRRVFGEAGWRETDDLWMVA